jgi:hypothetical protein
LAGGKKGFFMFSALRRIVNWIRELEPSVIREIIIIVIILIISVVLSLPEYRQDKENLRIWNQMHQDAQNNEN